MPPRPARSLKHEYELFVEEEIENYKESIPRSALLAIGDEAVRNLATAAQMTLTEMLLCEEVDRIIFRRLRLPAYQTWRRRRIKVLSELCRPEHWGLPPDDALVHAVRVSADGRVLVAGAPDESSALYLAANGCEVTAIDAELDAVQRVLAAAADAGLAARVSGRIGDLRSWVPEHPLAAVVCRADALTGLSDEERARVLAVLQSATLDGGVHLVQTIVAATAAPTVDELRSQYAGWSVTVAQRHGTTDFLARKGEA
jgi:hypothetical protein